MQDLRPLLNQKVSPYVCGLSARKIRQITSHFGRAAIQARKAGFDMVQIHGDRMLGGFASPVFNHRTDEYGGSIENRIRFAVEAVKAVRLQAPDLPIDFKLAVRQENPHYGNAGVLPEELSVIGAFMCQGRMPMAVRERYEKMCSAPSSLRMLGPRKMLVNFDRALRHPNAEDLSHLTFAVTAGCKPV